MQIHRMSDATSTAGGEGFEDLPIRAVKLPHPTEPGEFVIGYECEFTFDPADVTKIMNDGRLRICIMAQRVVPIHASVVGPHEA